MDFFGEVLQKEALVQQVSLLKKQNKKIVFTNGCFDILHPGHTSYLAEARSLGDILVVGMDSDQSVHQLKGPERPIQNEKARSKTLSALRSVDFICIYDNGDPEPLIRAVQPDILVKGGDWAISQIKGADFVQSYGGEVRSLQFISGHSTTDIVQKILRSPSS